ncbi:hypothetical protein niasHS_010492 [Heterodera schachtii]|uniref:Uncharacterized protein n=1 Tax=Heterodera schachtii TaxID=97005 RepID=A0ABD2IYG5_HETSC
MAPLLLNLGPTSALLFTVANLSLIIEPDQISDFPFEKKRHSQISTVFELLLQKGQKNVETIPIQMENGQWKTEQRHIYINGTEKGKFSTERANFIVQCQQKGQQQQQKLTDSNTFYLNSNYCHHLDGTFLVLSIGPIWPRESLFFGCVRSLLLNGHSLLQGDWCRRHNATTDPSHSTSDCIVPPIIDQRRFVRRRNVRLLDSVNGRFDERWPTPKKAAKGGEMGTENDDETFVVDEGGTEAMPLLKQLRRTGGTDRQAKFVVSKPPLHGKILSANAFASPLPVPIHSFAYSEVLAQQIFYRHDGSETLSDFVELRPLRFTEGIGPNSDSVSVPIKIVPINDAPSLHYGTKGPVIFIEAESRVQLSAEVHLRVVDPDSAPELIWLRVDDIQPSLDIVDRFSNRLRLFSLSELLHGNVFLLAEGDEHEKGEGQFTLIAKDEFDAHSMPLTVHVAFAPLKLLLDRNTGIRLLQQTSQLIESSHLHFRCVAQSSASKLPLDEVAVRYSVVGQPNFGVVECLNDPNGPHRRWALCSTFLQKDVDELRVRYRHTGRNRTLLADNFDFQVQCADSNTRVNSFQIDFVTLSTRVFVQETLRLNQTDQSVLSRRNLLATVFPHNFQPDQLVYNILEAPKLGMLLRRVPEIGKQRRVGVSSNFSQQQIDDGLISYKLHFAPFSVLNDFFTFRLFTPAGPSDETFRFEVVYLPGGNVGAILLINRTLIAPQGGIQQISNGTLWLESGDGEKAFTFRMALPPLNGKLALLNNEFGYDKLEMDGTFKSADITGQRLFYEHDGDQSRFDRVFLLAESELRDPGGGKGHTPIAFWLHISVVPNNSHAPQLLQNLFGAAVTRQQIDVLLNDERTLWPSLLPWIDLDNSQWLSLEQSLLFPVAQQHTPLAFHLIDSTVSRDFVIYAKSAPEMPLRDFTEKQLMDGQLVLRHLGSPREEAIVRYSVSDGLHSSPSLFALSASSRVPFLRLATPPRVSFRRPFRPAGANRHILFLLTLAHLRAETNENMRDESIEFEVPPLFRSPFWRLKTDGKLAKVRRFNQMEIFNNKIFFAFDKNEAEESEEKAIPIKIITRDGGGSRSRAIAAEQKRVVVFSLAQDETQEQRDANGTPKMPISIALSVHSIDQLGDSDGIDQQREQGLFPPLVVAQGGSAPIEWHIPIVAQPHDQRHQFVAKHHIVTAPKHGQVIFQRQKQVAAPSANYGIPLLSFALSPLLSFGSLQYVHNSGQQHKINGQMPIAEADEEKHDHFEVNITVQRWEKRRRGDGVHRQQKAEGEGAQGDFFLQLGPFRVPIRIYADTQLQLVTPSLIKFRAAFLDGVPNSEGMLLEEHFLRVSIPPNVPLDIAQAEFRLVQKSPSLALFNRRIGQPISSGFSHGQLSAGDIAMVAMGQRAVEEEVVKIKLRVCIEPPSHSVKCSRTADLRIHFGRDEAQLPTIVHNVPLKVQKGQKSVPITADHLQATHPSKMPSELHFVVWQQQGGTLQKGLNTTVDTFTQKELDHGFVRFEIDEAKGVPDTKMGFHFLLNDGRHQLGPEFFSLQFDEILPSTKEDGTMPTQSTLSSTPTIHLPVPSVAIGPKIERNAKLGTAPGVPAVIGPNLLKATGGGKIPAEKIIFHLTKQPMHGRLLLNGSLGRLERFSQADVDAGQLTYVARPDIGAWSQRDNFQFKMEEEAENGIGRNAGTSGEGTTAQRFRIESSYSNLAEGAPIDALIPRGMITDEIFIKLFRSPAFGWLERIDEALAIESGGGTNFGGLANGENAGEEEEEEEEKQNGDKAIISQWRSPLSAEQFASGHFLVFHQNGTTTNAPAEKAGNEDGFTLVVYSGREPNQRLKLGMKMRITDEGTDQLKIDSFVPHLRLLSGGSVPFYPADFHASHPSLGPSQIVYRIDQLPNTLRLSLNNLSLPLFRQFTQLDIDQGRVALEHTPSSEMAKWDVIGLRIGMEGHEDGHGQQQKVAPQFVHSRVLAIRIDPMALHLRNHSEIAIPQGKTYVLLSSAHLGAESNGERSAIIYNVTKRPENGTFFWVDGEKEASSFSQRSIDRGEVLYAQMNMEAFQDTFEFVLSNDEMELLPKKGIVRVQPVFQPQLFVTNARTVTQLGLAHLNATALEGTLPRYLVVQPPKHGRLFLHPNTNQSVLFFTHSDVIAGRLFFHAFDSLRRVGDNVLLELRSDSVQPARMVWPIEIRPIDGDQNEAEVVKAGNAGGVGLEESETAGKEGKAWHDPTIISPPPPDMNYHFPIAILVAVVALVIGILLCRRKKNPSDGASSSDEDEPKKTTSSGRNSSGFGGNNCKNKLSAAGLKNSLKRKDGAGTTATTEEKTQEAQKVPMGRGGAMASTENGRRFGVDKAINELRMGFANVGGANLLESTVYATINSNRRQQQQQQMMNSANANNKIISSSSSSPQNVQSNVINTLGDVNYAFSAPGSALLARRPSILPLSLAPTTTAPSSVNAIIPTFHASTGRQSSPTRRVIPTIALPPPSRSNSRERQQILASAAAAAIASKSVLSGTETVAMRRKSLEPERAQRRGSSEENRTEAGEAENSNEFWV